MKDIIIYGVFVILVILAIVILIQFRVIRDYEIIIQNQFRTIQRYENFILTYGLATIDTSDGYPQLIANKKVLNIIRSYWNKNKKGETK